MKYFFKIEIISRVKNLSSIQTDMTNKWLNNEYEYLELNK